MKTFWKRLLAVSLSAALLVGCAVSGLVLPVAADPVTDTGVNLVVDGDFEDTTKWTGANYENTEGYGGSRAYTLTKASVGAPTLNLSKSLVKDKVYVLRWKVKGGAFNLYRDYLVNNSQIVAEYSDDGWAMQQILFTANTITDTNTLNLGTFYNQNADPANSPIYLDDFELYEYYSGMNLIPAATCDVVPAPTGHGKTSFFKGLIDAGTKLSMVDDGTGNNVLLLDDVKQTNGVSANVGFLNLASVPWHGDHNVYKAGKVIHISYRYKVLNGATASLTLTAASASHSVVECKQSTADENGWVTVNAKITAVDGSVTYAARFVRGGTTDPVDIWVDDIFVGELVEAQIEEETATVEEGKTVNLTATATPAGKTINWTSSDNEIATVNQDGVVTGIKAGKATITASVQNGWSDTCEVTVTVPPAMNITKSRATVSVGSSLNLGYVASTDNVTWTSSDSSKATVADGVVTGVAEGTVTITAQVSDAVFDTCEVTVTANKNLIVDGTFEEARWGYNNTDGYGGSKAYTLTKASEGTPTFNLSKSLVKDQVYVLRWKIKGGAFKLYRDYLVSNSQIVAEYSNDGWAMQQFLFTANTIGETNTLKLGTFYNQNTDPDKNSIYLDDFELYEYYPGMNLIPAASCDLVPAPTGHGQTSFFKSLIDNGTKLSTVDDGTGNNVLLLDDVKQTYGVSANVGFLNLASVGWHGDHNVYKAGKVIHVSYRYKVLNGATASLTLAAASASHSVVECKQSTADENGWVTVNAKITAVSGDAKYAAYFVRGGSADPVDILVDDFYVGEEVQDFSMEMAGLGVHFPKNVAATLDNADGVRFGVKLNLGKYKIDEETDALQLSYNGVYYDVESMGVLLKRTANATELKLENVNDDVEGVTGAEKVWKSEAYDGATLRCVKMTNVYVVFAVNMMTRNPSKAFNAREYDARGYVKLAGIDEPIYTDIYNDTVIDGFAR